MGLDSHRVVSHYTPKARNLGLTAFYKRAVSVVPATRWGLSSNVAPMPEGLLGIWLAKMRGSSLGFILGNAPRSILGVITMKGGDIMKSPLLF